MPKAKNKLWTLIEDIKVCKSSPFCGRKYQLKLVGVDDLVWVSERDLSEDVGKNYQNDGSLAKHAKARVNRALYVKQKTFLASRVR